MDSFEERMKHLRGSKTQLEFADAVGITKQKVSNYEKGIVKPTYEVFYNLATRLGVNINWLLTGLGEVYYRNNVELQKGLTRHKIMDKKAKKAMA